MNGNNLSQEKKPSLFLSFGKGLQAFTEKKVENSQDTAMGQPQRHEPMSFNRGSY